MPEHPPPPGGFTTWGEFAEKVLEKLNKLEKAEKARNEQKEK